MGINQDSVDTQKVKTSTKYLLDTKTNQVINISFIKYYDINGFISKSIVFDYKNDKKTTTKIRKEDGKIIEDILIESGNGQVIDKSKNEIILDNNGKTKSVSTYNDEGDLTKTINFEYDEKGNKTKEKTYFENGEGNSETTYDITYNNQGQVKSVVISDDSVFRAYEEIIQTSSGGLKRVTRDANNVTQRVNKYTYNDNGNIIYHQILNNEGEVEYSYKYEYQYY